MDRNTLLFAQPQRPRFDGRSLLGAAPINPYGYLDFQSLGAVAPLLAHFLQQQQPQGGGGINPSGLLGLLGQQPHGLGSYDMPAASYFGVGSMKGPGGLLGGGV